MRPRKRVGVIDRDESMRAVRCFVLAVWGYRPFGYASAAECLRKRGRHRLDAMIAVCPNRIDRAVLVRGAQGRRFRLLEIARPGTASGAAELVLAAGCPRIQERYALRVLARRKYYTKAGRA